MDNRTLLLDSSYLLKRSINGAKNAHSTTFGHIGGLYSFFTVTRKLIKEYGINKVILFWDGENGGIYRHNLDIAYKANRLSKEWYNKIELTESQIKHEEQKEESLLKQKIRIRSYAEELFLRQIEVEKIEADDLIAQYIMNHQDNEELYLFTNDRDFLQLLDYNVTILFGNISEPITKRNFFMKFGYNYQNTLAMKIICGDSSDNIKGIKGISEKTLFKYFPDIKLKKMTVREICIAAEQINKERVKNNKKPLKSLENLLSNIKRLKLNYRLINLSKPFLNDEAYNELELLDLPLSPEGRSSKNLYKFMSEDDFLSQYGGSFTDYIQPFYTVIMKEKDRLNEYYKNNK
ncbi:MAG: hypothetical protein ACOCVF_00440 [bacterium]